MCIDICDKSCISQEQMNYNVDRLYVTLLLKKIYYLPAGRQSRLRPQRTRDHGRTCRVGWPQICLPSSITHHQKVSHFVFTELKRRMVMVMVMDDDDGGDRDDYRKTSNISRTLVGNKVVDNSDVVGASPVGAAPTTSSFSIQHLASMDWVKTNARGYKKHLNFGIWCDLY